MNTHANESEAQRYTAVAIAMHWAIALLILFNLSMGWFMEGFAPPLRWIILPLHFSSGITVLVLTLIRLIWRLSHPPPPLSAGLSAWERITAHVVHWIVYVMMFAMPLTGWALISSHPQQPGGGPLIWGVLHLPPIGPLAAMEPALQKAANHGFATAHSLGAYVFVALLVLHIAGALKHQIIDGERQLARMGLGRLKRDA